MCNAGTDCVSGSCTGGICDPVYSQSGTLTGAYDYSYVTRDTVQYVVQNNVWGTVTQTVDYDGTSFEVTALSGAGGAPTSPVSYPSVFIGSNNGRDTVNDNLPIQVSSITSVPTGWTWAANGATGDYDAAYDLWFSTSASGDPGTPSGGYLMVWLYDPPGTQPIGASVGTVTLSGLTLTVWYGVNAGVPVVTYVAVDPTYTVELDLNVFIQDAVARSYIQSAWYLTNVFAGFEIWSGGVGLQTVDFWAQVN
jgi:cellulose 1,4-beta-cellobiosidase